MRALAVIAVLAFHAGVVPGGFLGVDVFFVLSGYLITSGLLDDWQREGGIDLGRFWRRRARRLLPALLLVLTAIGVYAAIAAPPDTVGGLRGDALATIGYVANWRFIFTGRGYFASAAPPSLLQHTWSLAIEEQFYLVWPPVFLVAMRRWRRPGPVAAVVLIAVVLSAVEMAVIGPGTRSYFGTDTHAQCVLAGCALALLPAAVPLLRRAAPAGAALLAVAVLEWSGTSPWLYRGGFLLIAVATAAVIAGVTGGLPSRLSRLLSLRALAGIGRVSYGVYLWHWPVFLVVDGSAAGVAGWPLLGIRVAITGVLAALSHRLIEAPFMAGMAGRLRLATMTAATAVAALLLGAVGGGIVTAGALPAAPPPASTPHMLLLGDSVAATLGFGLAGVERRFGVQVDSRAVLGCGILTGGRVRDRGVTVTPPARCANWPADWAAAVRAVHPVAVAVLVGRWEVMDRVIGGRWSHIGLAPFDQAVATALRRAIDILTASGTPVVFLTSPYFEGTERADGSRWPQDDRARVDRFNAIERRVATGSGGRASVVDLGGRLSPGGRYRASVGTVRARWSDGVHITVAGGELVAPVVLCGALRSNAAVCSGYGPRP